MPKQTLTLNDFSGGLVDANNARDIPINALSEADNVSLTLRNSINTLGGGVAHNLLTPSNFSTLAAGDGNTTDTSVIGHLAAGYGIFPFESDFDLGSAPSSTSASGVLDQGSKYIMYVDCLNGQIHVYDYNTRTLNLNSSFPQSINQGVNTDIENFDFGGGTLTYATAGATGVGDTITDQNNTYLGGVGIVGQMNAGDYIRIENDTNNSNANNFQCLRIRDVNRSRITLDHKNFVTTTGSAVNAGATNMMVMFKPVFTYADNAVRISDGSFFQTKKENGDNEDFQTSWYGYINNIHFGDGSGGTKLDTSTNGVFNGWDIKVNELKAPTAAAIVSSESYPTGAGEGLNLELQGSSNLSSSDWAHQDYQIALSYVYENNQESLLYVPTSNNTFNPGGTGKKLEFIVYGNAPFDSRIKGFRFYARLDETNDPWFLLIDGDMEQGVRSKLSDSEFASYEYPTAGQHATRIQTNSVYSSSVNLETYEIINGFRPDEASISIAGYGEGYKTAVITNRRSFVANVRTKFDKEANAGVKEHHGDRIMYTPVNKFDTYPRSNFIDVVKGDSGSYVKLEAFADRLLAYKQDKLFLINIASPQPAGWFLENTKDFAGCEHPAAVQKAEFGVMWANRYGFWLYDGRQFVNLISGKIHEDTWESFYSSGTIVGFNPKKNYAVIVSDSISTSNTDVFVYDFRTASFTKGTNSIYTSSSDYTNGAVITNFFVDHDKNLSYGIQRSKIGSDVNNTGSIDETFTFLEWSETPKGGLAAADAELITKDIDFGDPGRIKRFYDIIITYKCDSTVSNPVEYAVDNKTSFTAISGTNFVNTSGDYDVQTFSPTVPFEGQSIRLKIKGFAGADLEINDITIQYRQLLKSAS